MELARKKVLVTGADGFIGSHLTEDLLRRGCKVRAFVFYNSFNSWGWLDHCPDGMRKNLEVVSGDIRDFGGVKAAMEGCPVVMHLAALISIPYSYLAPASFVDTNVTGTLNVVQAARELGVAKIIHTSTSEVYGTALRVPISEDHPLQAQSPYAASKIAADQIALSFFHAFGTPVTIVRPFNTYGPRQSARAVIPTVIIQAAAGKKSLNLGSVHPTRDFNYVADTVEGFVAVARADEVAGEVINVGSNEEISILDLVGLIGELMGVSLEIRTDRRRVRPRGSEVERLRCDNSKLVKLTGFRPRTGLREGLAKTIEWFMDRKNLDRYKAGSYNV